MSPAAKPNRVTLTLTRQQAEVVYLALTYCAEMAAPDADWSPMQGVVLERARAKLSVAMDVEMRAALAARGGK